MAAERAQEHGQEGPCLSAVQRQQPVVVSDLRDHSEEWPHFCKIADSEGFRAVLGLPLVLGDERIGSLDVYQEGARAWPEEQVAAATVLADIAGAYVLNASELARSRRTAEQLQSALDSRVVIEQAKGKLAGRTSLSLDEAFETIRHHARSSHLTVRSVAQAVLDEGVHVVTGGTP